MCLTRAELAEIWAAAPRRTVRRLHSGYVGLRIGEVLGLTAGTRSTSIRGLVAIDRQLQRIGNEMRFTTPKSERRARSSSRRSRC